MKPRRTPPIITLTTDFGSADHYVGTMKGVLLDRCRNAQIIDISHEIPPFSLYAGAYAISQAASFFPPGTVHVVVVDPGVGTARRALLIGTQKQYFIAPDNGVLSLVLLHQANTRIWEITNQKLWRDPVSDTFHGRDLFAPVAAALASGMAKRENVGPEIEQITMLPDLEPCEMKPGLWRGRILSVDHFGNVITNFGWREFFSNPRPQFTLSIGSRQVAEFRTTFGEAPSGLCFAYFGSSGYLEIGMNQSSAAEYLGAAAADTITLQVTID